MIHRQVLFHFGILSVIKSAKYPLFVFDGSASVCMSAPPPLGSTPMPLTSASGPAHPLRCTFSLLPKLLPPSPAPGAHRMPAEPPAQGGHTPRAQESTEMGPLRTPAEMQLLLSPLTPAPSAPPQVQWASRKPVFGMGAKTFLMAHILWTPR